MVMEEIMKNKYESITYFFQSGRLDRLQKDNIYAKEMFYGYHFFQHHKYETNIIEFSSHKSKFGKYFFLYFEKRLRNILKLPLYWSFITNKKNMGILKKSNYLVFSNNRMAASAIPMILFAKFQRINIRSLAFVMGLFSRTPRFKILKIVQKLYQIIMLRNIDKYIFLSKGEFNFATKRFNKYKEKFYYLPFAVDLNIWNGEYENNKRKYILFVGNDGNRDYELAEDLTKYFPKENFVFVSKEISENNIGSNSKIINGSWGTQELSDLELKRLYSEAKLTIIPLKNSLQPSGQSVSLQSIACGTPVLISLTDGFWDNVNFKDNENIFFAFENTAKYWADKITEILQIEKKQLENISNSGIQLIRKFYNLDDFNKKIETILKS
jgi:glycosyltransferase involved in cell wall biosynthesis